MTSRYTPVVHRSGRRPALPNPRCIYCGGNLYHDYDPKHRHNGYTCGMCGREQPLANGERSVIPAGGK